MEEPKVIVEEDNSEDEEDEWYARMESAAQCVDYDNDLDAHVQGSAPENDVYDNEDEYFNKMELRAKQNDGNEAFMEESSSVWQSMMRKMVADTAPQSALVPFTRVLSSDETTLMLCQQWLFSHFPSALSLYHVINSDYLRRHPDRFVYVDHKLHPSVVFTYLFKKTPQYLHTSIFSSVALSKPMTTKLFAWLWDVLNSIPTCKSLYLASTEHSLFETLFGNDPRFHVEWTELCKMYICDPSAKHEFVKAAAALPEHYEYCDLSEEDAEIINDTWKYRSEESIHMVRGMVKQASRCRGIRHVDDGLVAWCLTYEDGPLGMLQTIETHRKRGLGRCVVADLLIRILNNPETQTPPFCYIEQSNEASMGLFRSLGFYKTVDVVWSELTPIKPH